jgi:hypothetical protein
MRRTYIYGVALLIVVAGIGVAVLFPASVTYGPWSPRSVIATNPYRRVYFANQVRRIYVNHHYILRGTVAAMALVGTTLLVALTRRRHLATSA